MKTRFLLLLAAMLLGSASAFAQSGNNEPLKGDVNEDGTVDVADITAIIKIMKDGGGTSEETKCYYYVGTEKPTSLSQASVVESYPAEQTFTNPSTTEKCFVYVLTKADMTVNFYDPSDLTSPATTDIDTTTIPGYKITNMNFRLSKGGTILIKISPTYYFYVGTEKPTSLEYQGVTTVNEYPAEQTFTNTGTSGCYVYVLTNTDKTVNIYDAAMPSIPLTKMEDTTSIPGYKITTPSGDGINPSKLGINGQDIIRIK